MDITTGVGWGRSRSRRAEPRTQASLVVKCSNIREESMRAIDSSCGAGRLVSGLVWVECVMEMGIWEGGDGLRGIG